jgi:prevent-host-death family protein
MAAQLDMSEARDRMDELLARARSGEEIVLADNGTPVVKMGPASAGVGPRIFGEFSGMIHIADDFAAPLTEEELREWEK